MTVTGEQIDGFENRAKSLLRRAKANNPQYAHLSDEEFYEILAENVRSIPRVRAIERRKIEGISSITTTPIPTSIPIKKKRTNMRKEIEAIQFENEQKELESRPGYKEEHDLEDKRIKAIIKAHKQQDKKRMEALKKTIKPNQSIFNEAKEKQGQK